MIPTVRKYVFLTCVAMLTFSQNNGVFAEVDDTHDLIYTEEELVALEKFKVMMNETITEDFMRTDFYLMRWLRSAESDLEAAKVLLETTINWRAENNISSILEEDWEELLQDYHLEFSGKDKSGRPYGTIDLGDWNLRQASLVGKEVRLRRYLTYSLERGMHDLFRVRENHSNISRGLVIVDAGNLGVRTHLCASCLSILGNWVSTMDHHYPHMLREIIVINAPYIIKIVHNALWPIMSYESRAMIKSFNYNVNYWGPYLDERIEQDQRTPRYGGTREVTFGNDHELTNSTITPEI